jgi:hypothetical protein
MKNNSDFNHMIINQQKGENTLHPPKIVITNIEIMHLVFLGTCGHHILDYFYSIQVYCISFKLKWIYLKRNSNKHSQNWTYEIYLFQNNIMEYEKLQIYFKTKVMGGIL